MSRNARKDKPTAAYGWAVWCESKHDGGFWMSAACEIFVYRHKSEARFYAKEARPARVVRVRIIPVPEGGRRARR